MQNWSHQAVTFIALLLTMALPGPATASDFSGLAPIDARDYGVSLERLDSYDEPADAPYSGWMMEGIFAAVFADRMEFFVHSSPEQVRFGYPPVCHVTVPRFHEGKPFEQPVTLAFMVLQDDSARYCEGGEVMKFGIKTGDGGYRLPVLLSGPPDSLQRVVKFGRETPLAYFPDKGFRLDIKAGWDVDYCRFDLGDQLDQLSAALERQWETIAECAYVNYASGISTELNPDLQVAEDATDPRKAILDVVKRKGEQGALAAAFVHDRLYRQDFDDRLVFYGLFNSDRRPILYPEDEVIDMVDLVAGSVEEMGLSDEDEWAGNNESDPLARFALCRLTVRFDALTSPISRDTDFNPLMEKLLPYCWGSSERRKIMFDYVQAMKASEDQSGGQ